MKIIKVFFIAVLVLIPLSSFAQIKVEDSGGITVKKELGTPTTLYLVGDSASEKIPIFSVLSESQSVGTTIGTVSSAGGGVGTYSGTSTSYGQQVQRLCDTPCKLKLDPGVYSIRIGDNVTLGKKLDLTVSGGELAYKVYPGSFGAFFVGTLSIVFGTCIGLTMGGVDLALGSTMFGTTGDLIFLGSGAILTVIGIVLWSGPAFGSATPISPESAKTQFAR